MSAPNQFLVYATDVERATNFYRDLFQSKAPDLEDLGFICPRAGTCTTPADSR
ncbi:VOC family protein [Arthrobacter sp. ISL-5]|uniref:VOC family protein n=1 Tax=Arthrobacter sp. ISL-5 TaxID=2819111 RepID=UPI001BE9A84C|nr:hypothetical protein [Arthrobacter sp. ISL-5]MBT2552496.1 hypothetical protein [Arthrobacter sp. ISL-5]